MANARRENLLPALFRHLLDRVQHWKISADGLRGLARWLDTEPEVPDGDWYKRLPGFIVCGEGELVKTFLLSGQHPEGKKVDYGR